MLLITYDPLWETMRRKGITTYTLIKKYASAGGRWTPSNRAATSRLRR